MAALENRMRNALGTKVKITHDARGEGEVRIQYYNEEDLNAIADRIAKEE